MKPSSPDTPRAAARLAGVAALTLAALLCGCASQRSSAPPNVYRFDTGWLDSLPAMASTPAASASGPAVGASAPRRPTLIVNPVQAAAGYDSNHMVYQRDASHQQRFAYNEWVDTPARLLTPALMTTLARSGAFAAVVNTPSAAAGDLRLNVEIIQLVHDFRSQPSRVLLTLHTYVVDDTSRRVLAWRDIRVEAPATSEDPAGGVAAASVAVRDALQQLSGFCADVARGWQPVAAAPRATGR